MQIAPATTQHLDKRNKNDKVSAEKYECAQNPMNNPLLKQFTNQYPLQKTLRFELIPVGKTQELLEKNQIIKKDHDIQLKYEKTKPYLDKLHRDFVKESLQNLQLSKLTDYFNLYNQWKQDKNTHKKALESFELSLRKEIVQCFDITASHWAKRFKELGVKKLKKTDHQILFEAEIFTVLKSLYGQDPNTHLTDSQGRTVSLFDTWKNFSGYFTNFFTTRKNLYASDSMSGAIATRAIDGNLKIFCDNITNFTNLKNRIDFTQLEQDFNISLQTIFDIEKYPQYVLQAQIDFYNQIIGGKVLDNGQKIQGLNEYVNLYRQQTKDKIPYFKPLDKQILAEKTNTSTKNSISNQDELRGKLRLLIQSSNQRIDKFNQLLHKLINHWQDLDLAKIYISKKILNTIAYKWTNLPDDFLKPLNDEPKAQKTSTEFVSLSVIQNTLNYLKEQSFTWKERYYNNDEGMPQTEKQFLDPNQTTLWQQFLAIYQFEYTHLLQRLNHKTLSELLNSSQPLDTADNKKIIKDYADTIRDIYKLAKYFAVEKNRDWITEYELDDFYTDPQIGYKEHFWKDAYEEIEQRYNAIRNYLTQKPYSTDKWKLNFENPTLAAGWDKNKEADNSAVLLMKDGKYYLGIMAKGKTSLFSEHNIKKHISNTDLTQPYTKIVYKYLPDPSRMMPKVCFSKTGLQFFKPNSEILNIYHKGSFKQGDIFSLKDMHTLINFYKDTLKKYPGWQCYDFSRLRKTEDYCTNIGEFYNDVSKHGYKIDFEQIPSSYIDEKNMREELYLFEIHNKDFSEKSKGIKNLHTLYFQALFAEENRNQNYPIKLNGEAELFFRPKTPPEKLGTKKDRNEKEVTNHKRYSQDKIFFHVPITLNRTASDAKYFNTQVLKFLAQNNNINIIGIDRGEKHLIHYTVINQEGQIIESNSLNKINGVDYHQLLSARAESRKLDRQSWSEIENIKDLKRGYISQVISKITQLVLQHNAIIVMENLNTRFKQIRSGIEKSTYQQLEKALINKLCYLTIKSVTDPYSAGNIYHGYQLTAPFESFDQIHWQTGIMFYTEAAYTSQIDPLTGWRPNIYLNYANASQAKADILKFKSITFANNAFHFSYDIKNFGKQKEYPVHTSWTISSNVERYHWRKNPRSNHGEYIHYDNLTEPLKELFVSHNIDIHSSEILNQIKQLDEKTHAQLFKNLIFYLKLICQIRNTNPQAKNDREADFILSPIFPHFDSRKDYNPVLPRNGDANGSYNIARKGILILQKISETARTDPEIKKIKLSISNVQWDNYTSKNPIQAKS